MKNYNAHILQCTSLVGVQRNNHNHTLQLVAAAQTLHILSLGQSSSESCPMSASQTGCKGKRPSGTTPLGCRRVLMEGLQGQGLLGLLTHPSC